MSYNKITVLVIILAAINPAHSTFFYLHVSQHTHKVTLDITLPQSH